MGGGEGWVRGCTYGVVDGGKRERVAMKVCRGFGAESGVYGIRRGKIYTSFIPVYLVIRTFREMMINHEIPE
jgi:hypothetical protein